MYKIWLETETKWNQTTNQQQKQQQQQQKNGNKRNEHSRRLTTKLTVNNSTDIPWIKGIRTQMKTNSASVFGAAKQTWPLFTIMPIDNNRTISCIEWFFLL